ncbi:MAG TPA: BTAD domain-containing putative transcriptional regulator [Acidimicrobiales bacterium]|nr:BTAD domain-containing putative transcriptional regulator [Acidimicrobiales bacterium]
MVVVEATAGFGKSVLGIELVEAWRRVGVEVVLDHAGVPALLLAARLRAALERAGFSEAAAAAAGPDAAAAVDAMLAALSGEPCVFLVDDAHHLAPDAAALLERLAASLADEQRLVVLARRLPEGALRLRRAEYLQLSSLDLAITADEALGVCQLGFDLDVGERAACELVRASGGWTAATVLAAARAARTGESLSELAAAASVHEATGAVAALLEETIVSLGAGARNLLAEVAVLPLLDADVVDSATGLEGFFDHAIACGLPAAPARTPWYELPGPVCEHLSSLGEPRPEAIRRAANAYRRRGELGAALQLLIACEEPEEAAELLSTTPPHLAETLDSLEVRALLEQLPDSAVDAHPDILVRAAYELRVAQLPEQSRSVLARAERLAAERGDLQLQRAVLANRANEFLWWGAKDVAEELGRRVLETAAPEEQLTRARASYALGASLSWRVDSSGRRDEAALAEAEACFELSEELYRGLRMRSALSALAPYRAVGVDFARGHTAVAMRRLEKALGDAAGRPRRVGYVQIFRAWMAAELGDHEGCEAIAGELLLLGEQLDSDLFRGHAHWKLGCSASYRGDAEATLRHLRQAELHKGAWWIPGSGDFLGEAADHLDRIGDTALARRYLERLRAEPKDAGRLVPLLEAVIEARHGDPRLAGELLALVPFRGIEPREYWRLTLLEGYAAYRRGEAAAAGALAADAFEQAARLGHPEAPLVRERAVAEELLGLAAATGLPAAVALRSAALPSAITLHGRFDVTVGGRSVGLAPGQEARLLRFVAANGGRVHTEQAIEAMWPEVGPDAGRNRLRTVLNRLRNLAGPVLEREAGSLVVGESVRIDLVDFLAEAARAQSLLASDPSLAAAVARGAIARYHGDLLPEDLYEDWAELPRQRARRALLELLDLTTSEAASRGDLDAVRRAVERAIELAPYEDERYLKAVSALLEQGRRGEAGSILRRARSAFAELGLEPPAHLVALEREIVA